MTYDQQYQQILHDIMRHGRPQRNERTGREVKALPNRTIQIDPINDGFPLLGLRRMPSKFFLWEVLWFFAGGDNPDFFPEGSAVRRVWDEFREADGRTPCITGYRWRKHFGRDQIGDLVEMFKRDKTSRHGVVLSWDPSGDGLGGHSRKNIPCCFGVVFTIIDDRLCMTIMQRSADFILGAPHDIAGHAVIQAWIASMLGIQPGHIMHVMSNCHIYDCHYEAAELMLDRDPSRSFAQTQFVDNAETTASRLFAGTVGQDEMSELVESMNKRLDGYCPTGDAIRGLEVVQ